MPHKTRALANGSTLPRKTTGRYVPCFASDIHVGTRPGSVTSGDRFGRFTKRVRFVNSAFVESSVYVRKSRVASRIEIRVDNLAVLLLLLLLQAFTALKVKQSVWRFQQPQIGRGAELLQL